MTVKTWPGKPYPLGATWLGNGVNFAIFAEHDGTVPLPSTSSRYACAVLQVPVVNDPRAFFVRLEVTEEADQNDEGDWHAEEQEQYGSHV